MITGRWGRPSEVLLDIVVGPDGAVRGVANPGTLDAPIRYGQFDAATGAVHLEGEHVRPDGLTVSFRIDGRLDGRTLRLNYQFGDTRGSVDLVRVEEYTPPRRSVVDRVAVRVAGLKRWLNALSRPSGEANARRLRDRGESLESIVFRDAVAADIPALAELHVTTWNATYRATRGPTIATRTGQWTAVFTKEHRRDFVLVLEDRNGRLIGFTWGRPHDGQCAGELSKIYLRWEYHGLGLGRRMMQETARRFLDRGIDSFILFAELSNPTLGFYDRMGGERLRDDGGQFSGAYAWRDVRTLLSVPAVGAIAEHELDALAALMRDTIQPLAYYNEPARRSELAKYTVDGLRTLVAADRQAVLVARDDAGLIGFCISRYDEGTIWLSWFGTDARARGRGVGAALLAALAQSLPSRHAHKIWCDSRTDNVESRSVLERAGFRRIATLTNHWHGQDYYLWEWYPG